MSEGAVGRDILRNGRYGGRGCCKYAEGGPPGDSEVGKSTTDGAGVDTVAYAIKQKTESQTQLATNNDTMNRKRDRPELDDIVSVNEGKRTSSSSRPLSLRRDPQALPR